MPSDRARVTYDATRNWRGLIAQQGRVTLESDWNEATEIDLARDRQLTLDFVGPVGTPSAPSPGYVVTAFPAKGGGPGAIPGDLAIGSGTIYVGGERLGLDAPVTYSSQPEWLDSSTSALWVAPGIPQNPPGVPQNSSVTELVYLLAFEQEISAGEDSALSDVALGGPDTMGRLRIIQHFVRQTVTPISSSEPPPIHGPLPPTPVPAGIVVPVHSHLPVLHRVTLPTWWLELVGSTSTGAFVGLTLDPNAMRLLSTSTLQVSYQASSGSNGNGLAQLASGNGYLGAENQLIRVMVASTAGGAAPYVVWGFDDASSLYRVQAEPNPSGSQVTLTLDSPPIDSYHYPVAGQTVEVLRDEVWLSGEDYIASPTGFVSTVVTGYDPTTRTVVIGATGVDGSALPGDYLPSASSGPPTPAPAIDALTPSTAPTTGGTLVVVTGSGFTGAQTVEFGGVPGANLLVQGDGRLTVNAPGVQSPATVDVTVTSPLGTSSASSFAYVTPGAAAVTTVAPSSGVLYGGTLVTITGSGFTGASEVDFGGNAGLGLTVASDTSLTVFTPAALASTVPVTVITPQGNANSEQEFTYTPDPPAQVTGVSPASGGLAGGTIVTVTGSAFTGATAVDFGSGNPGTVLAVLSDTELTVVSPPAPAGSGGTVTVTVTTPAGAPVAGTSDGFTYELDVTGVSPAVGPPTGGTVVTVSGAGFTGATLVTFGGVAGSALTVQSDTQLTVTTPAGGGPVPVVVSAPGGSSPQTAAAVFSYLKTPQLYLRVWNGLASTAQGVAASGTYNFALDGTGVMVSLSAPNGQFHAGDFWRFAVRPLDPSAVYPARYLTAGQPPEGPRTWICPLATLVWNADGTVAATSMVPVFWNLVAMTEAFLNKVQLPVPIVSTIQPNAGPPGGGTLVTLTGVNFTGATTVYFGPNTGTGISVQDDKHLTVTSPAGSGIVDVQVINTGGESSNNPPIQFAYIGVTGLNPALGAPAGGTEVTVTGSGFTGASAVNFGAVPGTNMVVVSDTEITVTSPAGTGLVDVTVVNKGITSPTVAADHFAYVAVTSVNPTAGPEAGGTPVTVTGAGFSSAGVTAVLFGPIGTSSFQVVSDTTILVTTPAGSGAPAVTVATQLGITSSTGAPTFTFQGKNFFKDNKDLNDSKSRILDKTHEKFTEKTVEKTTEKVIADNHPLPIEPQVVERRAAAKEAEAKPPETAGSAGPNVAAQLSASSETEQGEAFIEPAERPEVGNGVVADDTHGEDE